MCIAVEQKWREREREREIQHSINTIHSAFLFPRLSPGQLVGFTVPAWVDKKTGLQTLVRVCRQGRVLQL